MILNAKKESYERCSPPFEERVEEGSFSLDAEWQFQHDNSQMRYFVEPDKTPNFDLRNGYSDRDIQGDENFIKTLEHILQWILANKSELMQRTAASSVSSPLADFDFVTSRGRLTKVFCTPYDDELEWSLAITKFQGVFYINEVETESACCYRQNRTESHKENMYWGYMFKQYTRADEVDGVPDSTGVVTYNEAFCSVVRTCLSDHRLLFSGEVDCRDRENAEAPPACYVELKISREINTVKKRSKFHRFKLLKWWAQSFLLGVPSIVVGFRNDVGRVLSVRTYRTTEIPQLVQGEYRSLAWKPEVCMNFCSDFLSFVKRVVIEDDPHVVYLFSRKAGSSVTFTEHRNSTYCFLPDWYVTEMR
ncbi:decapping and exoribonuclease protein-like [Hippocampus comes]|uniref:decapping and exoribonuclease protein-like n=1 Tax=Hippocampus comes TaxID=109280 RepID=UPI00094E60AB|nr:PREDICTED: decapping and exoribonuclease protein-like [Hippocampus comes]XP_019726954.1 PREDICTED: decapping and exoribonuclease protein-like [Hippocampus comes]